MRTLERVLVVDPGHRSGWATATLLENRITDLAHGVLAPAEMADKLFDEQDQHDVLIWETWRLRPQNGSCSWAQGNEFLEVQLIGDLRGTARRAGMKHKSYGPDRKRAFTASMPQALRDEMAQCPEQHDQDALMHLWGYTIENWVSDPANVQID
jgi:hypothetical protein